MDASPSIVLRAIALRSHFFLYRLSMRRECGFQSIFIPPAPGDEGIAIGCALYGLQVNRHYFCIISSFLYGFYFIL